MLKKDELRNPTSCLNKAAPDEPVFVLRGKDIIAAATVRHWATMAAGTHEASKVTEATSLANQMEDWCKRNVPSDAA